MTCFLNRAKDENVSLVIQTYVSRVAPEWGLLRTLYRLSYSAAAGFDKFKDKTKNHLGLKIFAAEIDVSILKRPF